MSGHHFGRAWHGTRIEDECPCEQAPCGLVAMGHAHPDCTEHAFARAKTMRQSHRAEDCPGPRPVREQVPAALTRPASEQAPTALTRVLRRTARRLIDRNR